LNQKILEGINVLADNVASTLGPRGRNVILQEKGKVPIITKDGVTVAGFVDLEDPFQDAAVQIIKQAASQTNLDAGDGTTTATILARAILREAQKYISSGVAPIEIKRGIDKAVTQVINKLKDMSLPISSLDDITHIATISANNDAFLGKLISRAVDCAGKDGAITVEESRSKETTLDLTEGFILKSGYLASAFVTDERRKVIHYEDPLIVVTDEKIDNVQEIFPILELAARDGKPLIFIAPEIEGQALAAMIMNAIRGTMKVVAVKAPAYGDERKAILRDLCLSTGATYMSRGDGKRLKDMKLVDFGNAQKIEITRFQTTIVGGAGDQDTINDRMESLKDELVHEDNIYECEKIQERIARLASGIAIIQIGAPTEIEMTEKKHRIEDALEAVKSAQLEGIVAGGGIALLEAGRVISVEVENPGQQTGADLLKRILDEPIRQMALNAGKSPDLILAQLAAQEGNYGYNFVTDEIVDMVECGIIDPVKVTRTALENAASVAGILITTHHAIIQK
jgi:chaperonin GroEL